MNSFLTLSRSRSVVTQICKSLKFVNKDSFSSYIFSCIEHNMVMRFETYVLLFRRRLFSHVMSHVNVIRVNERKKAKDLPSGKLDCVI